MFLSDSTAQSGVDILDQSAVVVLQRPCVHQHKAHCSYGPTECHAVATPPSYRSTAQQGSSTLTDRLYQGKLYSHTQLHVIETCASESAQPRRNMTLAPVTSESSSGQQLSTNNSTLHPLFPCSIRPAQCSLPSPPSLCYSGFL